MFNRAKFNQTKFNRVRITIIPPSPLPPIILDNMILGYDEYHSILKIIEEKLLLSGVMEYTVIIEPLELDGVDITTIEPRVSLSYCEIFDIENNVIEYHPTLSYQEV